MPHTRRDFMARTAAMGLLFPSRIATDRTTAESTFGTPTNSAGLDIVITLEIADGRLKQRVDEVTKSVMLERISNPGFAEERRRRTPYGATNIPAHHLDPDHVSIVANDGETIEWRCNMPFVVEMDRDPDLVAIDFTPSNPLGWSLPQQSVQKQGYHSVKATVIPDSGAGKQRFYKFTAWAGGLKLDPDVVCGDPPPNP